MDSKDYCKFKIRTIIKSTMNLKWTPCQGQFLKRDYKTSKYSNILVSWRQYDTGTLAIISSSDTISQCF